MTDLDHILCVLGATHALNATDPDTTGVGVSETGERVDSGGLPSPGGAKAAEQFFLVHVEAHQLDGGHIAKTLEQSFHHDGAPGEGPLSGAPSLTPGFLVRSGSSGLALR